jgi:hypothetical protein|tara:strand:- start:5623 stop:5874 length:252 start_codon:yes stop_codon:yes gene_type:complete
MPDSNFSNKGALKGGNYWQKMLNFPSYKKSSFNNQENQAIEATKRINDLLQVTRNDSQTSLYEILLGQRGKSSYNTLNLSRKF